MIDKLVKIVASRAKSLEELEISGKNWIKLLSSLGVIKKGYKILDFGAGVGRFSLALKEFGCDVIAIDTNKDMVSLMASKGIEAFKASDLKPVSKDRFDLVIAMFVFQHNGVEKVKKIIKQISKVSDKLCFTVPTEYKGTSYKSQKEGTNETHGQSEVSYVYTEEELREIFKPYFSSLERIEVKNENVFLAKI